MKTTIGNNKIQDEIRGDIRERLQPIQSLLDELDGSNDPEVIKELIPLCRDNMKKLSSYDANLNLLNE